jgi:hypothetical protein
MGENILSYDLARGVLDMVKLLQGGFLMTPCREKVDENIPVPYFLFSHLFCKNRAGGIIRRVLDNNELFRMIMIVPSVLVSFSLRKLISKSTSSLEIVPSL